MDIVPIYMIVSLSGRRGYSKQYELISTTPYLLGRKMTTEQGTISFEAEIKIPQVYGEFSSLGLKVGVTFPGNPENLEEEVGPYANRIAKYLQTSFDQILVSSGKKAIFSK